MRRGVGGVRWATASAVLLCLVVGHPAPAGAGAADPRHISSYGCWDIYGMTFCNAVELFQNDVAASSGIRSTTYHESHHVVVTSAQGEVIETVDGQASGHILLSPDGSTQVMSTRFTVVGTSAGGSWCETFEYHFANGALQKVTLSGC